MSVANARRFSTLRTREVKSLLVIRLRRGSVHLDRRIANCKHFNHIISPQDDVMP